MKKGVIISYGDIAIGAKESFKPTMENATDFSDVSILEKSDVSLKNYVNPCELYSVLLDGSGLPFPSNLNNEKFYIWSESISGDDGYFAEHPVLTLKSDELFVSSGITMSFGEGYIFPIEVNVKWMREGSVVFEDVFYPNSARYFFNKRVDYYDELIFEFVRMNVPFNRLKISGIEYGVGVSFYGDELQNVKVIQEIDPISSELAINTLDFTINSKKNIEFSFQSKQAIVAYFDGKLISKSFVETAKRKNKKTWSINAQDYIGLMDSIPFVGGVYQNKNSFELVGEIFSVANIPFSFDDELKEKTVSGYIPYCTCREALMQVCFAISAVVDTSGHEDVKIFSLSNDVVQTIDKKRIMEGQSENEKTIVTAVEVSSHSFVKTTEEKIEYDSEESGAGENIKVLFGEPLYDLRIENGDILEHGTNYAIINARSGCQLIGKKYIHTKTIKAMRNPLVSSSDIENIVAIQNATLVSIDNIDNILLLCYNYIVNSKEMNAKIVDGKHVVEGQPIKYGEKLYGEFLYNQYHEDTVFYDTPTKVGDVVEIESEFYSKITARIIKQSYSLVGNVLLKNSILR